MGIHKPSYRAFCKTLLEIVVLISITTMLLNLNYIYGNLLAQLPVLLQLLRKNTSLFPAVVAQK